MPQKRAHLVYILLTNKKITDKPPRAPLVNVGYDHVIKLIIHALFTFFYYQCALVLMTMSVRFAAAAWQKYIHIYKGVCNVE